MMIKRYSNILHLFILFFVSLFLINSELISNIIWKLPKLFIDFTMTIDWLECHSLGHDLITNKKIDCGTDKIIGTFNYGYAFLNLPYNKTLDIFYRSYFPFISIFIFIYMTIKLINPKDKISIILLYLALLNPSTLLLLERLNFDFFIYIIATIIVFNKIYFLNWLSIIYLFFIKIYPITLLISIFIENKQRNLKNTFIIIIILALGSLAYLYFNKDAYMFFLSKIGGGKAGYHFLFSLNSIPKIFKYIFEFNYQFLLLIICQHK